MSTGKKQWIIPDAFWHPVSNGLFPSHEAICVLNCTDDDALLDITLYFEDKEPMTGFCAKCNANRTNHIRMDKLTDKSGNPVPQNVPYAILVNSNVDIVVQYSRMDTSQKEMALMTTIAY